VQNYNYFLERMNEGFWSVSALIFSVYPQIFTDKRRLKEGVSVYKTEKRTPQYKTEKSAKIRLFRPSNCPEKQLTSYSFYSLFY
jgi:hypothetical protein